MAEPSETPGSAAGEAPASTGQSAPRSSPEMAAWWDERAYRLDGIGPRRQAFSHAVTHTVATVDTWLRRHWLGALNTGLGLFIGVAVAAPILRVVGITGPSQAILNGYHLFCAQTPSHSFYIAGHQVCLCERCLAIYSSLLLGGLLLAVARGRGVRVPILQWWWWVVAMLPMALDGGTQLFGLRESNVFLRLLTGGIFGLVTAWFALPQIQEAAGIQPAVAEARTQRASPRSQ
jgi:uncharacterized membrane protein